MCMQEGDQMNVCMNDKSGKNNNKKSIIQLCHTDILTMHPLLEGNGWGGAFRTQTTTKKKTLPHSRKMRIHLNVDSKKRAHIAYTDTISDGCGVLCVCGK